jgi:hypothetical protein
MHDFCGNELGLFLSIKHEPLQENVERMFFDVTSAKETQRFVNLRPHMNTVWQVLALQVCNARNKLIKSYLMKEQFTMTSSCGMPAGTSKSFFVVFLSQIGTAMM